MFCFKLWSKFGVFRDPLTITQNLTFPIPPKTTIGGMMASILGIDYNEYFNDPEYFDFKYSIVLEKPVRKKSFAQNYVADYTKGAETKVSTMEKCLKTGEEYKGLIEKKEQLEAASNLSKNENKFLISANKKIETALKKYKNETGKCSKVLSNCFRSPKPIFREILIKPEYLIFIKNFKYSKQMISTLKSHFSAFSLYMGNSEFPANYLFIACDWKLGISDTVNSFISKPSDILFESGKKYTNIYMATKTIEKRKYREYKNFIICDKPLRLKNKIQLYKITTDTGKYYCEFV